MGYFIIVAFLSFLAAKCMSQIEDLQPLKLDLNAWWGPHLKFNDTSIRPFKVVFDDEIVKDLRRCLWNQRHVAPPLEGVGFEYGFNRKALYSWLQYWEEEYPFKKRETFLNQFQ